MEVDLTGVKLCDLSRNDYLYLTLVLLQCLQVSVDLTFNILLKFYTVFYGRISLTNLLCHEQKMNDLSGMILTVYERQIFTPHLP